MNLLKNQVIGNKSNNDAKLCLGDFTFFSDLLILFFSGVIVFGLKNEIDIVPMIGKFIIGISIYMFFKLKNNKKIVFLIAVISFINISLGFTDLINNGSYVADWQRTLRNSEYNVSTAKSVLLFLSILNSMLTYRWIQRKAVTYSCNEVQRKNNLIISYVGLVILFIILLTGYSSEVLTSDVYVSNSNPLYEYALVIYLIVWLFSEKSKFIQIMMIIYSACYILYSLNFGDRSAAFLMLALLFMIYYEKKISVMKLLILVIVAVFIANIIAVIRSDGSGSMDFSSILANTVDRGLYSDTVSYSYYSGITITALHHKDMDAPLYFFSYVKSLFLGTGSSEYSSLSSYARSHYTDLFNRGGGFFFTSFYAWFGYIGIALSAYVLGLIIRKVYSRDGVYAQIYQILIIVFSFRWYLYSPTVFFRSVFVVATVAYGICLIFDHISRSNISNKKDKKGRINYEYS